MTSIFSECQTINIFVVNRAHIVYWNTKPGLTFGAYAHHSSAPLVKDPCKDKVEEIFTELHATVKAHKEGLIDGFKEPSVEPLKWRVNISL